MAGSADIRAGKAFVELYLQKSAFTQGLKNISREITAFGAGVTAVGKRFALLGAAITAPMLAAARSWASAGAELARMSQRTGVSVESLSALKYAAAETGVGFEAVEGAMHKSNRMLTEAASGSAEANLALANLGLTVDELASMTPEKRFSAMADALSKIQDPALRDGLSMQVMGRGAAELSPLLGQGAAGLSRFREEAEKLGLVKSKEAAAAALELTQAWTRFTAVAGRIQGAIGQAIAPMITNWSQALLGTTKAAGDWMKAHQPLVQQIFQIGAAASIAGAGLLIAGKAISLVGSIFKGVTTILGVFGHAVDLALTPLRVGMKVVTGIVSTGFSLLKGAVSAVIGGFQFLVGLAMGAVKAAMAGIGIAVNVVTTAFQFMAAAVNLVRGAMGMMVTISTTTVSVIGGIAAAIGGMIAYLPLLLPLALVAIPLFAAGLGKVGQAAGAAAGKISAAAGAVKDMGAAAIAAGARAGQQLTDSAQQWGTAALAGAKSWGGAIQGFFGSLAEMVGTIIGRVRRDVVAGFENVSADVLSVWGTLQDSLQAGDMSSVWKIVCATMKLEWARFSLFLQETWEELKPSWNKTVDYFIGAWNRSIAGAGKLAGGLFADLKIGWGDLWDSLLGGLHKFLDALDKAFDSVYVVINQVKSFMGSLPGAYADERKHAEDQTREAMKVRAGESKEDYTRRMTNMGVKQSDISWKALYKGVTPVALEDYVAASGQAAVDHISSQGLHRGAALASFAPGARTPEQKKADDDAAKAAGAAIEKHVGGLKIENAPHVAPAPPGSINDKGVKDARSELDKVKAEAAAANAAFRAKQEEERQKAAEAAGLDKDGKNLKKLQQSTHVAGTFSGRAAGMIGGGTELVRLMASFFPAVYPPGFPVFMPGEHFLEFCRRLATAAGRKDLRGQTLATLLPLAQLGGVVEEIAFGSSSIAELEEEELG